MATKSTRAPESCPHRALLQAAHGAATHACTLALRISKAEDQALCAVRPDECAACCRQREPRIEEPNPMVASTLYGTLLQIREMGGVEGCDLRQAEALMPFARDHLLIIVTPPGHPPQVSTPPRRKYAGPCRHLGLQTGERACATCRGNVRQKTFACHHPLHTETTIRDCQNCAHYVPGEGRHAVEKWMIGLTTAPRSQTTLQRTLASFRAAGWKEPLHVFAEPGTRPKLDALDPGQYRVAQRIQPALGAWGNFLLALTELCLREPAADAYFLLQDDVRFGLGLRPYLEATLWPGTRPGVVSLHTPAHLARQQGTGFFQADLGWGAWGAQAFIFSNAAARAFLSDAKVMDHHLAGMLGGKMNVDSVVGDWCRRSGRQFWLHAPSLTEHTGSASTLWKGGKLKGRRKSADFPGDRRPISTMLEQHRLRHGASAPNAIVLLADGTIEERKASQPSTNGSHPSPEARTTPEIHSPPGVAGVVNYFSETAVVVTCHPGYVPYLDACLARIDAQIPHFHQRILVLDGVRGAHLHRRRGWQIVQVDVRNPNSARNAGLELVRCAYVIFWDADNRMPGGYLASMATLPAANADDIAFFYPHIIYHNEQGQEVRRLAVPAYDYWLMREQTFVDTASIWKTVAVRTVGGWSAAQPGLDDYELALRLTRNGWRGQRSDTWTSITEHPKRRSYSSGIHDSLWTAWTLGIVTLWGGRTPIMRELLEWYATADLPPHSAVYWVDNTASPAQRAQLERAAASLAQRMESLTIISAGRNYPIASGEDYQTWARHQHVANLYNAVIPRVREDLLLFVEDDNLPAVGTIRTLHKCLRTGNKVAAVGAVYSSRNAPANACGSTDPNVWNAPLIRGLPHTPFPVAMMGGGCALYWNSAVQKARPFRCMVAPGEGLMGWDANLGKALTKNGYELKLHGGVRIPHHCPDVLRWLQANSETACHG